MRTGNLQPSASGVPNIGGSTTPFASGYFDALFGDGSNLTGVAGGTGFGYSETKLIETVYQAATDGIVTVQAYNSGSPMALVGYTDSTNPPTTALVTSESDLGSWCAITFPVKRGNYWKVYNNTAPTAYYLYWTPVGGIGSATAGGLGAWESKVNTNTYLAGSDGFVLGHSGTNGQSPRIYTDSSSSPTTMRSSEVVTASDSSVISPVRKGDYWKAMDCTSWLFWIPISYGSGSITINTTGGGGEDTIARGFECSWVSTTQITVNPGILYHGTTRIGKVSATTLDVSVATDYWDGNSDRGTSKVVHVYCDVFGNIKMSDAAPNCADSFGNTAGQKYYWSDGSKYWRWVWCFYLNSTGSGEISKFMSILGGKAMKYLPSLSVYASTAPNENTWTDVNMAGYISTAVSRTIQVGISAVGGDAGSAIAIGVKAKGESGEVNVCYSSISQDIQNEGAMAQTGPAAYAGIGTRVDTQVDSDGVFQYEIAEYSSTSLYGNSYVYLHRIYFDSR